MKKTKLFLVILIFFSNLNNAISIEPDIFVQSTVNRASKLLGDNISKDEKNKLKQIARETVDIQGIGILHLAQ